MRLGDCRRYGPLSARVAGALGGCCEEMPGRHNRRAPPLPDSTRLDSLACRSRDVMRVLPQAETPGRCRPRLPYAGPAHILQRSPRCGGLSHLRSVPVRSFPARLLRFWSGL